jgi:hypothetical protein
MEITRQMHLHMASSGIFSEVICKTFLLEEDLDMTVRCITTTNKLAMKVLIFLMTIHFTAKDPKTHFCQLTADHVQAIGQIARSLTHQHLSSIWLAVSL